jgi:hypothetical protein
MTTEEKKQALIDAGRKVRSNASDESINELYEEFIAETAVLDSKEDALSMPEGEAAMIEEHGPIDDRAEEADARAEIEAEAVTIEVAGPEPAPISDRQAAFNAFLEANQDKMMGDKTPAVVAWARANLTKEEYEARYAGRTLPI